MTTELTLLGWTLVLALVQIMLPATLRTRETGSAYNVGPRDEPGPPVGNYTGRLQRAEKNLFETLPLFIAAVLLAHVAGREGSLTLWGARLYLGGRLVYLPLSRLRDSGGAHAGLDGVAGRRDLAAGGHAAPRLSAPASVMLVNGVRAAVAGGDGGGGGANTAVLGLLGSSGGSGGSGCRGNGQVQTASRGGGGGGGLCQGGSTQTGSGSTPASSGSIPSGRARGGAASCGAGGAGYAIATFAP